MSFEDRIKLVPVRLGIEYPAQPKTLEIVDLAAPEPKPFPSKVLLEGSQKGLVDESHADYPAYRDRVLTLIAENIRDHRMLVLPEFSFCEDLERETRALLARHSVACIVVGGSYYQRTDGELRIVSPVFANGEVHYQTKYKPAKHEKPFGTFVKYQAREILVFCDTGYGDFAVQICSDGLHELFDDDAARWLQGKIDCLIVVSRNRSAALTERLHDLSRRERWGVVYVNGDDARPGQQSTAYLPAYQDDVIPLTAEQNVLSFDVSKHYAGMLRGVSDTDRFQPAPRHWPFKGPRALTFGKHLKVLAIGSHFDDIWLGCLGTLMMLAENYAADVVCTSLCEIYPHPYFGIYPLKDRTSEIERTCASIAGQLRLRWHHAGATGLTDRAFEVNKLTAAFDELRRSYGDADLVFVPRSDDLNAEHRETARLGRIKFQSCDVFEYEVKDFRSVPFRPNVFVDLGGTSISGLNAGIPVTFAEKKAEVLVHLSNTIFRESAVPFKPDRTRGRMSFRAAENAKACNYAEAFVSEFIV